MNLSNICLIFIWIYISVSFAHNITQSKDNNETVVEENDETTDTILIDSKDYEYDENGEDTSFKVPQDPAEFMDYFEDLMKRTRVRLEEIFEQYMPQLIQMSSSVTLSPDCTYDAVRILFGLRKLKPWAIKILDSSGKVPDGILGGTLAALGSFDDCLESTIGDEGEDITKGQYCAINIRPYLPPKPPLGAVEKAFNDAADAKGFAKKNHFARIAPLFYYLKLRLGLCVPASCTLNDLSLITHRISHRFRVNVTVQNCDVKESFNIEMNQITPFCIIAILLLVILIATVSDIVKQSKSSKDTSMISNLLTKCWLSFSICSNSNKILSTKVSDDAIKPLYGMKVISLIWIIIAHSYLTMDFRATGRLVLTRELPKGFFFQIILNASLAIETFFFLSGTLVTFTTLKKMKSAPQWNKINWFAYYLHRYIRLTPAIMLLIVILLLAYRMGNGPLWQEIIFPSVSKCRENWWAHALYVSNFIPAKNMCFLHLWYIAADMQLFLITPLILTLLHRKPYYGKLLLTIIIGASIVCTGVVTYLQQLPPTLLFNNPDPSSRRSYGNLLFIKPYPHAAPYMIGMLTGYLLYSNSYIKLTKRLGLIGWIMTVSIVLFEVFTTWHWNKGDVPNLIISTLYASLFRVLWALAMSWIVIACHNGFGDTIIIYNAESTLCPKTVPKIAGFTPEYPGIRSINAILSCTLFIPLSKISYVAYLIHPGLMYIFVASTRNIFAFSHYFVIQLFFSHLTTTFLVSFVFSLIIEYPFSALEEVLHNYILSAKYSRKVKLYSVTQYNDPLSDSQHLNKSKQTIHAIEKYNKLKPFAHISDIQYMFNANKFKISQMTDPTKPVYNCKL